MLRVGLIGCGFMGGMHAACYKVIEGVELVAVADVREDKAKAVAGENTEIYADGMSLIENADVDAVDICLPTYLHTEHAIAAMKKGMNVFLEKPACLTKEEGKALLEAEKETGVSVQIGQVVRVKEDYAWFKKAYDSGVYGKLLSGVFYRLSPLPTWAWDGWLLDGARSGSVAQDMHIHDVDFVRYLMGKEPDSFEAQAVRSENGSISQIFTTFAYGDARISVEGCWDYPQDFPFQCGFRVKCEKATIVHNTSGIVVYHNDGGVENIDNKPQYDVKNDIGGNVSNLGCYYTELKHFVDKLNANEKPEIAPLCEAVKSVDLVLDEIASVGGARI